MYYTEDSLSVEFYDCIYYESMLYCRRPKEPIPLQRDKEPWNCSDNGIVHSFATLWMNNITVSTVLHKWKSGVDKAEEYSHYLKQLIKSNGSEKYLCECNHTKSFGINCEYLLPNGTTFVDAIWDKFDVNSKIRKYGGDIVCYTTLECDSGLLCLDWREICNGFQNCMSGYDEENCDKLEFNECEKDEYRCMNGMCIPDEYFLDGHYDCMDMSDEKEQFETLYCPLQLASFICDEQICPPYHWSCGDGQCISNRNAFRYRLPGLRGLPCMNRRFQLYYCEASFRESLWTSSNGQCYQANATEKINFTNLSINDNCTYLLKCSLYSGTEKICPCRNVDSCSQLFKDTCSSLIPIQYPKGGLLVPYGFQYFDVTYSPPRPSLELRGTIKCRGHMHDFNLTQLNSEALFSVRFEMIELSICTQISNLSNFSSKGYHQFCHNDSKTFNNHFYSFIDVCKSSGECISSYKIKDGVENCITEADESQENEVVLKSCSNVQHHRFRCSIDQPTCLYAKFLGDSYPHCENKYDENWMGTQIVLSKINCNTQIQDGCQDIRRYIEASWKSNIDNDSSLQDILYKKIPFPAYCDTFRDLILKEDENSTMCQSLWICSQDQWRCYTGQCIHIDWVLDGEWDCPDASDEENMFAGSFNTSHHNYQWLSSPGFNEKFTEKYAQQPFGKTCNLTIEYPCLPINMSDFSNDTRTCIDLTLIGNGRADCIGGYDERSAINHCDGLTTLGYHFKCLSTNTCVPYLSACVQSPRCPNQSDDDLWCQNYENRPRYTTFKCRNGTHIREKRCDGKYDCLDGEDEYMCHPRNSSDTTIYREEKEYYGRTEQHQLQLPQFPIDTKTTEVTNLSVPIKSSPTFENDFFVPITLPPYWCNRGIGIFMSNGSIACFCPPQYHGDQCQYHSDRITVFLHLNLKQSTYTTSSDKTIVIKLLVLFLFDNQILGTDEFHIRPATEINVYNKKRTYFHYSRSSQSLKNKKQRYLNRSNIINEHPYSIRIEAYEMKVNEKAKRFAVWKYPIYFDYLPVYRFAKVLRLTKRNQDDYNPCKSNPCNQNQECYQLLNLKSQHICLCKSNFSGPDCAYLHPMCNNSYCSPNALCQPLYRGSSDGKEHPYCICPTNHIGQRCELIESMCSHNVCKHGGTCFQKASPDDYSCECTTEYDGKTCENKKQSVKLYINKNNTIEYEGIVVQYFKIVLSTFELKLVNRNASLILPDSLSYLHKEKTAPEIVLLKLYWLKHVEIYLISLHVNVTSIEGNTSITEENHCMHVNSSFPTEKDISVFKYHHLCKYNRSLFCFRDERYICICDKDHYRTECFGYNYNLDHCSNCLANGRCLKGEGNEHVCICPPCHTGSKCQFNFESFSFTLDQLFFHDLLSNNRMIEQMTYYFLIITPCILFLLGLANNIFCFATFRRPKCLRNGIGQYLFYMSAINQINLTILVIRLVHLTMNITHSNSHPIVNDVLCKISSYLLISSSRIIYWFSSLIAIERIYVTLFLNGHWLKKPHIARRLILFTIIIILIISAYELGFIKSQISSDDGHHAMCVLNFPLDNPSWTEYHKVVTIINALVPFSINLCCTIGIICIVTKNKMNANVRIAHNPVKMITTTNKQEEVDASIENVNQLTIRKPNVVDKETPPKSDVNISEVQLSSLNTQNRFRLLIDVITENKELVVAPAITLIPQLFSLPFFIASFFLGCQDFHRNNLRYLLIVSYFTTFIPQLTSFFLYISPSSFYSREWSATDIGKWLQTFKHRHRPAGLTTKTSNMDGTTK